jgi:hypothetical protein
MRELLLGKGLTALLAGLSLGASAPASGTTSGDPDTGSNHAVCGQHEQAAEIALPELLEGLLLAGLEPANPVGDRAGAGDGCSPRGSFGPG